MGIGIRGEDRRSIGCPSQTAAVPGSERDDRAVDRSHQAHRHVLAFCRCRDEDLRPVGRPVRVGKAARSMNHPIGAAGHLVNHEATHRTRVRDESIVGRNLELQDVARERHLPEPAVAARRRTRADSRPVHHHPEKRPGQGSGRRQPRRSLHPPASAQLRRDSLQFRAQLLGGCRPGARILHQTGLDQPPKVTRQPCRQGRPVWFGAQRGTHPSVGRVTGKRGPPRQALVQHASKRPQVARRARRFTPDLLRTHVSGAAEDPSGPRVTGRSRCCRSRIPAFRPGGFGGRVGHDLRQAEVQDLHLTLRGHHHVRRLQVSMHDATLVRRAQPPRHL